MKKISDIKKCRHVKLVGKHIMVQIEYDGPYIRLVTPKWLLKLIAWQEGLGYRSGVSIQKQKLRDLLQ